MPLPLPMALALSAVVVGCMLTQLASDASLQHHPFHMRGSGPHERGCVQPHMKSIWFEPFEIKEKTIKLLIKEITKKKERQ